jgi:hypothetical protein
MAFPSTNQSAENTAMQEKIAAFPENRQQTHAINIDY